MTIESHFMISKNIFIFCHYSAKKACLDISDIFRKNFEMDPDMISMICQLGTQWKRLPGQVLLSFMFFLGHFRSWKCIFHNRTQTYAVRIDWYHSNWLDELICMFPSVSLVSISQCQKSRIKVLKFRKKQSVKIRVQNFEVIVHDLDYQLLWLYKNE